MEKIKEYRGIIIIVLVLILGAFYWYSYRPSRAIVICGEETRLYAKELVDRNSNISIADMSRLYDIKYEICLNKLGIKK